jgi:hypothetical protein
VSDDRQPPQPSELVYVPGPSWLPLLAAAGLTGVLVGLFAGWSYTVVGAILLLAVVRTWFRKASDDVARLPREQHLSSAVLPAVPLRGPSARPTRGQSPRQS